MIGCARFAALQGAISKRYKSKKPLVIKKESDMKVTIDADACVGCGLCASTCPEVYVMEGDKAVVVGNSVPKEFEESAKKGAEDCPVTAITVS